MTCQGIGQPSDPPGSPRELIVSLSSIAVIQWRRNGMDLREYTAFPSHNWTVWCHLQSLLFQITHGERILEDGWDELSLPSSYALCWMHVWISLESYGQRCILNFTCLPATPINYVCLAESLFQPAGGPLRVASRACFDWLAHPMCHDSAPPSMSSWWNGTGSHDNERSSSLGSFVTSSLSWLCFTCHAHGNAERNW